LARCGPPVHDGLSLGECIGKADNGYFHIIQKNNGIREENLVALLQPVGIDRADIDSTWLNTVDTFGFHRGEVAHSTVGAQKPIAPLSELVTVRHIRDGFADMDKALGWLVL